MAVGLFDFFSNVRLRLKNKTIDYNENTILNLPVSAGVTPTTITVTNEATDTTCYPLFTTAPSGDLPPKTNSSLSFNASTGALSVSTLNASASVVLDNADTGSGVTLQSSQGVPGSATVTFPLTTGNAVIDAATQTLTNKTLTSPSFTLNVTNKTATYTVTTADSGKVFTTSSAVTFNLPAATAGLIYTFVALVGNTQNIYVTPASGDFIYNGADRVNLHVCTGYGVLQIVAVDDTRWMILSNTNFGTVACP